MRSPSSVDFFIERNDDDDSQEKARGSSIRKYVTRRIVTIGIGAMIIYGLLMMVLVFSGDMDQPTEPAQGESTGIQGRDLPRPEGDTASQGGSTHGGTAWWHAARAGQKGELENIEVLADAADEEEGGKRSTQVDNSAEQAEEIAAGTQRRPQRPVGVPSKAVQRRRLVLHFDINKTLIMFDTVSGKSLENVVNALLADYVWGYLVQKDGMEGEHIAYDWVRVSRQPSVEPPVLTADSADEDKELVTYRQYVEELLYPLESMPDIDNPTEETASLLREVMAHNDGLRKKRGDLCSQFTAKGHAGEALRSSFERLLAAVQAIFPPPSAAQPAVGDPPKAISFNIVPAFYEMMIQLQAEEHDFAIVFRTFGDDLPEVVMPEFNEFCSGRHPRYPTARFDGSVEVEGVASHDYRVSCPGACATMIRDGPGPSGMHLVSHSLAAPPDFGRGINVLRESPLLFYRALVDEQVDDKENADDTFGTSFGDEYRIQIASGYKAVYGALMKKLDEGYRGIAIRDDYDFWKGHSEDDISGKPLLLPDDSATQDLHIFFDDNIFRRRSHIVDPRSLAMGANLSYQEVAGRHIMRVDPIQVILDTDYYINAIRNCEKEIKASLYHLLV